MKDYEFNFQYTDDAETSVQAQPVVMTDGAAVSASGRTFLLQHGNIFSRM